MQKLNRRLNSPRVLDAFFTLVGTGSVLHLGLATSRGTPAVEATEHPLLTGVAVLGVLIAAAVIGMSSSRMNQTQDEYAFQILAKSALIGMVTFVFGAVFWSTFFADSLGDLPTMSMLSMALGGWSLGYLYTRLKGTSE